MIACIHSLKAKAEEALPHPPPLLPCNPAQPVGPGAAVSANGDAGCRISNWPATSRHQSALTNLVGGTFYFQARYANDFKGFVIEILACPAAIHNSPSPIGAAFIILSSARFRSMRWRANSGAIVQPSIVRSDAILFGITSFPSTVATSRQLLMTLPRSGADV